MYNLSAVTRTRIKLTQCYIFSANCSRFFKKFSFSVFKRGLPFFKFAHSVGGDIQFNPAPGINRNNIYNLLIAKNYIPGI